MMCIHDNHISCTLEGGSQLVFSLPRPDTDLKSIAPDISFTNQSLSITFKVLILFKCLQYQLMS